MKPDKEVIFKETILDVLTSAVNTRFSSELAGNTEILVQAAYDMTKDMVASLTVRMPAEKIFDFKMESSAWQLFKKKWFPKWLLKKYPIRYSVMTGYLLHPEISTKPSDKKLYYAVQTMTDDYQKG